MTDQELYLTQSLSNNNGITYEETTIDEYGSNTFKPFAKEDYIDDDMDIDSSKNHQETSLQRLKERIEMTEQESKSSLVYVMQNTNLVNDDHLLGFLYAEKFDVDVSKVLHTTDFPNMLLNSYFNFLAARPTACID